MDARDARPSTAQRQDGADAWPNQASRFPSTRWSWIDAARDFRTPEAREALSELCQAYWKPIYALIRRRGHGPGEAADLTQEYFARLLEGRLIDAADREKGRFRTLLRTDCGFFLADEGDRRRALKRGGGVARISLDVAGEGWLVLESSAESDPEFLFDRQWALTLLERTMDRLARREAEAGRGAAFERLCWALIDSPLSRPYAEIASDLGTTVGAVQAAVVRLRKRYREVLRSEIAVTLHAPSTEEIDDEIRTLRAILAR